MDMALGVKRGETRTPLTAYPGLIIEPVEIEPDGSMAEVSIPPHCRIPVPDRRSLFLLCNWGG